MIKTEERIAERRARLAEIEKHMMAAEVLLVELVDSYDPAIDGTFSACHPRMGFASMRTKLVALRRGFLRAKV
ncbi:TPA: hypothetical protein JG832_002461 [Enterobacter hormaechei subsp. xiangfangensis]|nr:hypothetical protein [Enterobacter hormaechei subsp. xiangfangensis]HAV1890596.1 hypothetical protein [Enterobacter hormaechei subsp. xiangfangensis]